MLSSERLYGSLHYVWFIDGNIEISAKKLVFNFFYLIKKLLIK